MTLKEVETDLDYTLRDITRCDQIANNIELFIIESCGEDRSQFKSDLLKWRELANEARRLKTVIQAKREELL